MLEGEIYGRRTYRLTDQGLKDGQEAIAKLEQPVQTYIGEVVNFVRSRTFPQLVSAIYKAFPEMKQNSVFYKGVS